MSYEASLGDSGEEEDVLGDPVPTPTPIPSPTPKAAFQTNDVKKVYVITLKESSLPFATGSAKLPPDSVQEVRSTGAFLAKHPEAWTSLVVKGHTDSRGSKALNKKLSQARANEVKKWLVKGGSGSKAMAKKITAVGMGSTKPIMRGNSETAWAKNRRVDLEFKGVKDAALLNEGVVIGR
jgi:outer membrane protein OmpA-like peptidoglycan-associated protein